jgi:hypothetical protein
VETASLEVGDIRASNGRHPTIVGAVGRATKTLSDSIGCCNSYRSSSASPTSGEHGCGESCSSQANEGIACERSPGSGAPPRRSQPERRL